MLKTADHLCLPLQKKIHLLLQFDLFPGTCYCERGSLPPSRITLHDQLIHHIHLQLYQLSKSTLTFSKAFEKFRQFIIVVGI